MNLIKLVIIIGVVYALTALFPGNQTAWRSSSKENISMEWNNSVPIPDAFKLIVRFKDGSRHTHIQNNGTFPLHVFVTDRLNYISSGQLSKAEYVSECTIESINGNFSGNLHLQKTVTTMGSRSLSDLKQKLRKDLIKSIIKELHK